jgi:hypothetical protein
MALVKFFTKSPCRAAGGFACSEIIVRRMPASLLFPLPLLALAACGPTVTNQNLGAVNEQFEAMEKSGKALSIKEVESMLGPPTRVENFPIEMRTVKELPGVRYYYTQGDQTVELHFIDNKLIRRVLKFGEHPAEEKDMPGARTMIPPVPIITPATPVPPTN